MAISRVYTGDPVRDAEHYYQALEEARNTRDYFLCDECHGEIFKENEYYDGDEYYELDGKRICGECIDRYIKDCRRTFR